MTLHAELPCFQSAGAQRMGVGAGRCQGSRGPEARPGGRQVPGQPGTRGSAAGRPPLSAAAASRAAAPAPSLSRELPATPPRAAAGRTCATRAPTRPCHRPPDSETATSAARPRLALPRRSAAGRLTPGLASQVPGAQDASSAAAR